jgi:nifR3 family TIM-barrel protein
MRIGNIDLGARPLLLAPMEDVTDIGFRLLCRRLGAAMVYSEFVNCDALVRLVKQSMKKLEVCDEERPVAIQIYGKDSATMADAARIVVEQARPDVLDINFGCPVKKIATKGAGAGLLQDPPRLLAIARAVVDAVGDSVPVTAKTRLGWDHEHKIIVSLAEQLQDCGISALTIHGRTRSQLYTDTADWTLIGEVRRNPRMRIPIIGNGDIHSIGEAEAAFDRYGVDGVMIGRATFGQPWVFSRQELTTRQKVDILKEQVLTSVQRLGEYSGILHSRRHLAASPLFKGIPDFRQTRIAMLRADTVDSLFEIIEKTYAMIA